MIFSKKKEKKDLIWTIVVFIFIIAYGFIVVDNIFKLLKINNNIDTFYNLSGIEFVSAIFIAPILEEFIFRTHLSYERKHFYGILLIILASGLFYSDLGVYFLLFLFLLFIIIVFFYNKTQVLLMIRFPKATFLSTSIIFCVFHFFYLKDYDFTFLNKVMILLLHYLPLSLFLGFIRKKYGLSYSMMAHSVNNILVLLGNSLFF